ncbi:hypothetical protein PsYK624_091960 [Phanerochaete sordida]|uniref:Hydrophobin n=1 Tax=Phanerochaete sordida TaxID=48140 RepID=A0A9P3GC48_9APHY|nr:hypothetical protein PsYK624_091960 [Phanerochaete sordida]
MHPLRRLLYASPCRTMRPTLLLIALTAAAHAVPGSADAVCCRKNCGVHRPRTPDGSAAVDGAAAPPAWPPPPVCCCTAPTRVQCKLECLVRVEVLWVFGQGADVGSRLN